LRRRHDAAQRIDDARHVLRRDERQRRRQRCRILWLKVCWFV
jgi:hypothetical protein